MPRPKAKVVRTKLFTAKMFEEDYIEYQAAATAFGTDMTKLFYEWAVEKIKQAKAEHPERFERSLARHHQAQAEASKSKTRQSKTADSPRVSPAKKTPAKKR